MRPSALKIKEALISKMPGIDELTDFIYETVSENLKKSYDEGHTDGYNEGYDDGESDHCIDLEIKADEGNIDLITVEYAISVLKDVLNGQDINQKLTELEFERCRLMPVTP